MCSEPWIASVNSHGNVQESLMIAETPSAPCVGNARKKIKKHF